MNENLVFEEKLPHWKDVLDFGIQNFGPWLDMYGEIEDEEELWNGWCNRVANILKDETDLQECGGRILYTSDEPLEDGDRITSFHWFVEVDGRYYDASRPDGVDRISDLPVMDLIAGDFPGDFEKYLLWNTMVVDRASSETVWDSSKTLAALGGGKYVKEGIEEYMESYRNREIGRWAGILNESVDGILEGACVSEGTMENESVDLMNAEVDPMVKAFLIDSVVSRLIGCIPTDERTVQEAVMTIEDLKNDSECGEAGDAFIDAVVRNVKAASQAGGNF